LGSPCSRSMIIWVDAQLAPALAPWIEREFGIECNALRDVGLRDATDWEIFKAGKARGTVMTKDSDFVKLQDQYGSPPQVIWLSCGNTSNQGLACALDRLTMSSDRLIGSWGRSR